MKAFFDKTLSGLFIKDFNLCFFVSLFLLSLYPSPENILQNYHNQKLMDFLLIPFFNGIFTTIITIPLNRYFAKKNYTKLYHTSNINKLALVSFSAGFLSIYMSTSNIGTYVVSLLIIYVAFLNVKDFISQIANLLEPNKMATPNDLGEFGNFFINLIISFTVINLSLDTIHNHLNISSAFNFGKGISSIVDAMYFSIITMTTVGYGHIIPQTMIAKILVSIECLTSYIMLGIMIGIITRGIKLTKK